MTAGVVLVVVGVSEGAGAAADSVAGAMAVVFGRLARGEFGREGGWWVVVVVVVVAGGGVTSLVMVWLCREMIFGLEGDESGEGSRI